MRYTLMNQEHEVLEFTFEPGMDVPRDVRMLEGAAWAPPEMPMDGCDPIPTLDHLLKQRAICDQREDVAQVLEATGAGSTVELALRSGGFSLSDQYWYRGEGSTLTWEGSNFFDNGWDLSFGEAILRRDYGALAHAAIQTPDVTAGGLCRKAWAQTERGLRLLKATASEDDAEVYCETLVSRMLGRMLKENEFVSYEPMTLDGEVFSTCPVMLGKNDELICGTQLFAKEGVDVTRLDAQAGVADFDRFMNLYQRILEDNGVPGHRQAMAKLFVMSSLALDFDTHPANFGLIRDLDTLRLRQAPLFDYGGGFTYMRERYALVCKEPLMADLILGLFFSRLDPSWDYSWYDSHSLDGFEDEVEDTLSGIASLPQGYAKLMSDLFVKQRNYVNRVVESSYESLPCE